VLFYTKVTAATVAHEIGHNFGMKHDSKGDLMMATSAVNGHAASTWSSESVQYIASFMSGVYGEQTRVPRCLEPPSADRSVWSANKSYCGDGFVEDQEECDSGFGRTDPCCSDACMFKPGCECAANDPCCTSTFMRGAWTSAIQPAGLVCREAMHTVCDTGETCDGRSPLCPTDLFSMAGRACETNEFGSLGKCYHGRCVSGDDECRARMSDPTYTYHFIRSTQPCGLWCLNSRLCNSAKCELKGLSGVSMPDGTNCGTNKQCKSVDGDGRTLSGLTVRSQCVESSSLAVEHWAIGEWGPCREDVNNRTVECRGSDDKVLADSACLGEPPPKTGCCGADCAKGILGAGAALCTPGVTALAITLLCTWMLVDRELGSLCMTLF
jgi:hypothetical protein